MKQKKFAAPLDAVANNFVDYWAPLWAQPYLRLSRLDRPIGTWLLLLPCWWSVALASEPGQLPSWRLLLLFALGAVVMRGAGCTFNDLIDRDIDALVERTRNRPIPSGQVSIPAAIGWMLLQAVCGLLVLLQFPGPAIWLGVASLTLLVLYPFMKRVTWWPQFFLGLAFNWGALMGEAAAGKPVSAAALCLYAGGIAWTLGYDTIYAHQDKEDDALIGVKSTARRLGQATRPWLFGFYGVSILLIALTGVLAGLGWPFFLLLGAAALHLIWQVRNVDLDRPNDCLAKFRANRETGLLIFLAIAAGQLAF